MNIRYPIYEGVYRILTHYGNNQNQIQVLVRGRQGGDALFPDHPRKGGAPDKHRLQAVPFGMGRMHVGNHTAGIR